MPLPGRILLVLFAAVLLLGLAVDQPRPLAIRPAAPLTAVTAQQSG
jgi:hypothetical protein